MFHFNAIRLSNVAAGSKYFKQICGRFRQYSIVPNTQYAVGILKIENEIIEPTAYCVCGAH